MPGSFSLRTAATTSSPTGARGTRNAVLPVGQRGAEILLVDVQDRRELGRVPDRVDDVLRVGVHGRELDRHREVAAVAVEDVPRCAGTSMCWTVCFSDARR